MPSKLTTASVPRPCTAPSSSAAPVLNCGFGGSTLADVVYYADRIVLPYHPRLVVLYAGDNDLTLGRTPAQLLREYRAFVSSVRSAEPATRVVFVSIKPSPSRRAYLDRARETNRRIQAEIARDSLQTYVDVFTPMLEPTGQPRPELFVADSLHLSRAGYLLPGDHACAGLRRHLVQSGPRLRQVGRRAKQSILLGGQFERPAR